jgi:hypothetical protein
VPLRAPQRRPPCPCAPLSAGPHALARPSAPPPTPAPGLHFVPLAPGLKACRRRRFIPPPLLVPTAFAQPPPAPLSSRKPCCLLLFLRTTLLPARPLSMLSASLMLRCCEAIVPMYACARALSLTKRCRPAPRALSSVCQASASTRQPRRRSVCSLPPSPRHAWHRPAGAPRAPPGASRRPPSCPPAEALGRRPTTCSPPNLCNLVKHDPCVKQIALLAVRKLRSRGPKGTRVTWAAPPEARQSAPSRRAHDV